MIEEFQGEFRWLSNFVPAKIILDGVEFPSVEHAYVSAKCDDAEWKMFCSDSSNTSADIKRKGRGIQLKDNWNDIKVNVMRECVTQKFNQEPYRTLLIETGDEYIQEGNRWGDKFWGVYLKTGQGENNLGKLIMEIRESIKQ